MLVAAMEGVQGSMLVLELGLGMNRKTHDCMRSEVLKNMVTMTQLTTEMGGLMKFRIVKLCSSIISGSINMIFVMRATDKIFISSTRTLIEECQEEQKWVET